MPAFNAPSRYDDSLWSFRQKATLSTRWENVAIHPTADIADDVEIGPFTVVGPHCKIGPGNRIDNNVTLYANVELGEANQIYPGTVIGGIPQDKKYCGESSRVVIGARNVIREYVTINSGTKLGDGHTGIGSRNLIMAGCHIAHDCVLRDDITIANNVLLGGHVKVESFASFGGLAAVHHFVTIGTHAFVGGLTRVIQDVPPYMLVEGNPSKIRTVNKVGLKRRGFSSTILRILKEAHRQLFRSTRPRSVVLEELLREYSGVSEVRQLVNSLASTATGSSGRALQPGNLDEPPEEWSSFPVRW